MLFFQTSHSLPFFQHLVDYTCGDSLKKHLIQTVFFQLLNMEEVLWWSWKSVGPMVSLHGMIKSQDNLKSLSDQIHPMVAEPFREGNTIFQDDNASIHTAKIVYEEYSIEVEHPIWAPQSLDVNIIENLWYNQGKSVKSRYIPPSSLKELENVLDKNSSRNHSNFVWVYIS